MALPGRGFACILAVSSAISCGLSTPYFIHNANRGPDGRAAVSRVSWMRFEGKEPMNYPWALEFQIEDPDGNVIRFGSEPL